MGIGQKIKDVAADVKHAVTPGSHKHTHETGTAGTTGLGTTGYETAPAGYATTGATEYGTTGTAGYGTTPAATGATYDTTGQYPGEATGTERMTQEAAAAEAAATGRPAVAETVTTAAAEPAGRAREGAGAVCGAEHFTVTEDRPVVKERVEYVKEHRPVEKEYVVETRATGAERAAGVGHVEHLGTEERIVSEAAPRAPCD